MREGGLGEGGVACVEDGVGCCAGGDGGVGAGGFWSGGRGRGCGLGEGSGFGARGVVRVGGGKALDDDDADGFLLGEVAFYVDDADGEEAGFIRERFPRAVVDVDGSVGGEAVEDPEVAVADGVGDWEEAGVEGDLGGVELGGGCLCRCVLGVVVLDAEVCGLRDGDAVVLEIGNAVAVRVAGSSLGFGVLDDGGDVTWFARLCDDGCDTSAGGQSCSYDLGAHSAGAQRRTGTADVGFEVGNVLHHFNWLCVGVLPWVCIVETVDVGHEEEIVRLHHAGRDGAQGIVVTKLDFGDSQRVVLVHDRDNAHV